MIRNLNDFVFLIGSICFLFITTVTAPFLGIKQVVTFSTLILFLFAINYLFKNLQILNYEINQSITFYFFVVFIISFKISLNGDILNGLFYLKDWLTPILIMLYFETLKSNKRNILKKVLLFFFIAECLIGIYEKFTLTHLFGSIDFVGGVTEFQDEYIQNQSTIFRAKSLLGNPLNNAHLVCIMVGVILNSNISLKYVYILMIIGILSILCFNARAATISIFLVAIIYFQMIRKNLNSKQINSLIFIFIGGITIILFLMFNSSLGGRLIYGNKLVDDSTSSRFGAYDIYNKFYNYSDPLLGNYTLDKYKLTENGYINLFITLGIPFAFLFILAQFFVIFSRLRNYNFLGKCIILICFFIVGSSNNNLAQADSFMMLLIWLSAFQKTFTLKRI